jgi:hypothetical protein
MSPEDNDKLQQLLDEQTLKGEPSLKAEQLTSVDAMLKSLANNSKINLPKQIQVIKDGVARNQMDQARSTADDSIIGSMFPPVMPNKTKVYDDDGSQILPNNGERPNQGKQLIKDMLNTNRFKDGYFLDTRGVKGLNNDFERQFPAGQQNMLNNQAVKDNEARLTGLLKSIAGGEIQNPEMNKTQYELMDLLSEKEDPNVPNFNNKLGELAGLINHLRGNNLPEGGDKQFEWDNGGRREAFLKKNPMTRVTSTINNTLERLNKQPLPKHPYSYSPDIEKDVVMALLDKTRFSGRTPPLQSPEGKMIDDYKESNTNLAHIERIAPSIAENKRQTASVEKVGDPQMNIKPEIYNGDPENYNVALMKLLEQKYGVK